MSSPSYFLYRGLERQISVRQITHYGIEHIFVKIFDGKHAANLPNLKTPSMEQMRQSLELIFYQKFACIVADGIFLNE